MNDLNKTANDPWEKICALVDLPHNAGVAALLNQDTALEKQIALFRRGDSNDVYAISNFDPFSQANVLARGILCSISGELAIASPVLKQHFSLSTGQCFEDEAVSAQTYSTKISEGQVFVQIPSTAGQAL